MRAGSFSLPKPGNHSQCLAVKVAAYKGITIVIRTEFFNFQSAWKGANYKRYICKVNFALLFFIFRRLVNRLPQPLESNNYPHA